MNARIEQKTENATEFQDPVSELQPLHEYLDLLKTSLERYEYLKKSGVPDVVLYIEKGLIDRQFLFLSKVYAKLKK
jgi:hypothetical protein